MEIHRGSRGAAALILNLDTRWRGVVSITLWPFYPREGEWSVLRSGHFTPEKGSGQYYALAILPPRRGVVSITLWPFYPREEPQYPLTL